MRTGQEWMILPSLWWGAGVEISIPGSCRHSHCTACSIRACEYWCCCSSVVRDFGSQSSQCCRFPALQGGPTAAESPTTGVPGAGGATAFPAAASGRSLGGEHLSDYQQVRCYCRFFFLFPVEFSRWKR